MPDRRTEVRLGEYETVRLEWDQLSDRDTVRLRALQARRCLTLDADRTGWRLRADSTVGILVLDHVRLVVEPKFAIPGERLMDWLGYALGAPAPVAATARRWVTGPDGYAGLVAAALLKECEGLVREGLRRDYLRHDTVGPVLRGRLDFAAQAARRYGQLDRLHVRTFERETDIWDNRVLGTALRVALTLATGSDLARDLRGIAGAFPHAATPEAARNALDRIRYTRLNARYRPAHTWARLLLRGGGVTDLLTDGGATADGLLLPMPGLWEAVVRRLGTEAAAAAGGHAVPSAAGGGIRVHGGLGKTSVFRPDLLLRLPVPGTAEGHVLLPVDAKYKRYDRHGVSAGDTHQLLTYIAGFAPADRPAALIVHPQPGAPAHRALRVEGPRGALGVIHVLGIDTHASHEQAVAWIRRALEPRETSPAPA
ncbi:McrC family protein [Streptomyces fuscichromogenes]|uniref:McrC family protein n=1 Tax=Streptomyces fuscichromogenes TaxID=1324013 RepID=UPI00380DF73E